MSRRRVAQGVLALGVIVAGIVGPGGIAFAAYNQATTGSVAVNTLKVAPPGNVHLDSCTFTSRTSRYPTVVFDSSPTRAVIASRPPASPPKELEYAVSYTSTGGDSGSTVLPATATSVSGPAHTYTAAWTVTFTTTYAGWKSTPVTIKFNC